VRRKEKHTNNPFKFSVVKLFYVKIRATFVVFEMGVNKP
jgi:hypothetical protein